MASRDEKWQWIEQHAKLVKAEDFFRQYTDDSILISKMCKGLKVAGIRWDYLFCVLIREIFKIDNWYAESYAISDQDYKLLNDTIDITMRLHPDKVFERAPVIVYKKRDHLVMRNERNRCMYLVESETDTNTSRIVVPTTFWVFWERYLLKSKEMTPQDRMQQWMLCNFEDPGNERVQQMEPFMCNRGKGAKSPLPKCAAPSCSNIGCMKCSRCKAVRYCSADCQRSHWKLGHRKDCCSSQ